MIDRLEHQKLIHGTDVVYLFDLSPNLPHQIIIPGGAAHSEQLRGNLVLGVALHPGQLVRKVVVLAPDMGSEIVVISCAIEVNSSLP